MDYIIFLFYNLATITSWAIKNDKILPINVYITSNVSLLQPDQKKKGKFIKGINKNIVS